MEWMSMGVGGKDDNDVCYGPVARNIGGRDWTA